MKIKLTESKVCIFLMTLLVFLDMKPYFTWSTVTMLGYRFYTMMILVTTAFMAYMVFFKKRIVARVTPSLEDKTRVSFSLFVTSMLIVLLFFYQVFCSGVVTSTQQPFNMAMLSIHLGLMFFMLQDNITLQRVFLNTKTVFAVVLIPSIFVFLLVQVGIIPPSVSLSIGEGAVGDVRSYDLYFGAAVMIRQRGVHLLNRLCGIFEEPGFVGTMGVFFLFGDRFSLKDWRNVVILIACAFTFSLAFVVLLFIGVALHLIGRIKNRTYFFMSIALVVALVLGYFAFMSLPLDGMLGNLQSRLEITEEGLAGDNRFGSSEWAVAAYESFLKSDWKVRLLGYGKDLRTIPGTKASIWMQVHSYREIIFSFGYIGLGLMIVALLLPFVAKFRKLPAEKKWPVFVFLALFMISIYQRYNVTKFHYFCQLFGGAANLVLMDTEPEEKTKTQRKRLVIKWGS